MSTETATLLDPAAAASAIAEHAAAAMPAPASAPTETAAPAPAAEQSANPAPATAPAGTVLTDRSGKPFDSSRHKSNPDGSPFVNKAGYFMPIGGRKPGAEKAAAPAAKPAAPASTVSAAPVVSSAAADASAASAWSAEERVAAATPAPSETPAGDAAQLAAAPADDRGEDAKLSPEQAGELCARLLYTGTGAITGDHATAAATGAEHVNLVKLFTAFLRHRGYTITGWGAIGFGVLLFLVDDKRRASVFAKVRSWFGSLFGSKAPRRVEPAPAAPGPAVPARAEVVEEPAAPAAPRPPRADFIEV